MNALNVLGEDLIQSFISILTSAKVTAPAKLTGSG